MCAFVTPTHTHIQVDVRLVSKKQSAAERDEMGQYYVAIEFGHFWLLSSVGHLGTVAAITVTEQQFTLFMCVYVWVCTLHNKLDKTNYNYKHTHTYAHVYLHIFTLNVMK